MNRIVLVCMVSSFLGCGGALHLGGKPEIPEGGKGTWVVNPVTPDAIEWKLYRGTAPATAPLQTGDWLKVKCVHCMPSTQLRLTAWTMKGGSIHRTLYLDTATNHTDSMEIELAADDEELRVMWTYSALGAVPSDFVGLSSYTNARVSGVTQGSAQLGELQWGPVGSALAHASDPWMGGMVDAR